MGVNRNGFQGFTNGIYNQEDVNNWWAQSGQQGPPPVVPSDMVGLKFNPTRAGGYLTDSSGKKVAWNEDFRNFTNFWNRTAVDPYHRQSGVSRLAGNLIGTYGALQGNPVWTAMTAVERYGNEALGTNDNTVSRDGVQFGDPAQYGRANTATAPGSQSAHPLGMAPIGDIPKYAPIMGTTPPANTGSGVPNASTSSLLAGSPGFTGTPAGTSPMADTSPTKLPKGTQYTRRDPWYEDMGRAALNRAGELADRPYTPYTGERVAGLSANEQVASDMAAAPVNYGSQIARLSAGYSPEAISGFMNPYVDNVLGARTREINNAFTTKEADLNRNAAATDAFRSGRSDRQRAQLAGSRMRAIDEATADTKKSAFDAANQMYLNQGQLDASAIGALEGANRSRVASLSETGATQRGIAQAEADFDYGQFLERRDWNMNNLNTLLNAIGAVNSTAGTWNYGGTKGKKDSSTDWAALAGTLASAYGEYAKSGG